MIKTKKNFKSIFKTFALAFTTLALMLGVFLGNGLPQVKAEEADELTNYYTAEKIEEIKISQVSYEDTEFYNKHILCDITEQKNNYGVTEGTEEIEFFAIDNLYVGESYGEVVTSYIEFKFDVDTKTVSYIMSQLDFITNNFIDVDIEYTYKYFVGGDSHEYVYLFINESKFFTSETFVILEGHSWYISEAIEVPAVEPDEPTVEPDEPTVEPDEPTVEPDEPTVEPDEPTVEPDEPTDDNNQEEKDGFVEMLGNTAIEVFALENISAYSAGIATIGTFVAFIVVAGTAIAIIAVSKKR